VDGGTVEGWFPLIRENETARLGEVRVSVRYSRLSLKLPHLMGRTAAMRKHLLFFEKFQVCSKEGQTGKEPKIEQFV
jgi:hypothetical protein